MLTGVIHGTFLCCEKENFTVEHGIEAIEDETVENRIIFLYWIVYYIIIPIILIVGILGNLSILIVLSATMFRGIAYLYLKGLAMAHVGVLISWIPICVRLGYGMSNNYPAAFYHAHLELVALNSFAAASVLIMTCLIVERYIFIFFPARIRSGNARKNVGTYVLSSFIIGFTVSAPLAGMRMVYEQQGNSGTVFTLRENIFFTQSVFWSTYIWIMEVLVRICPSIVFILLNSLVIKRFLILSAKKKEFNAVVDKFKTANTADTSLLTRNKGYREEKNLTTLTTVMVLYLFLTMISPILISIFYPNFETSNFNYQAFRAFSTTFELSNFAIYIFVYFICSKEFRKKTLQILQGKRNQNVNQNADLPIGEIEDYSRHGTTIRLTPEHTKLNSTGSPSRANLPGEEKETYLLCVAEVT